MSKRAKRPQLLNEVLQAIADIGEARGCTVKKILRQVEESIISRKIKPKPRNVVMQVHKAVNHGVVKGLLKKQSGKVFLIMGKKPIAKKPVANKRKKRFHERLRKDAENRRRNPAPKTKKKKRDAKPNSTICRRHEREDTDTSSINYSSYYPSSRSETIVSTGADSYEERRRSRRLQKQKDSHRRRKDAEKHTRDSPHCSARSSPSRRTSKNCIEIPRDDEADNANAADETNNCCGSPDCLCNPDRN